MPEITDLEVTLQGSALLFFIMLLAGAAVTFFMYRRTVPPLPHWKKLLLAIVRVLAATAIIAMLFTPVIHLTTESTERPVVALMVDVSASMNVQDRDTNRRDALIRMLNSPGFSELQKVNDVRTHSFDRRVTKRIPNEIDTLSFNGEGTDISEALRFPVEEYRETTVRGIVLVSDGLHNLGENPVRVAEKTGVPVFAVGVGDAVPQKDILISNLQVNEIVYSGNPVQVTAVIKNTGYEGMRCVVTLFEDGKNVAAGTVQLPESGRERSVSLEYQPAGTGTKHLRISVSPREDELTTENNHRDFFVKVLESKIDILIVSGRPNQDYNFFKRSIEKNNDFSVTGLTLRPGGTFYSGAKDADMRLDRYDLFVFIDFPVRGNPASLIRDLLTHISMNKKPVLYIRGRELSNASFASFKELLRIQDFIAVGSEEEVYLLLNRESLDHPVFRIADDPNENETLWNVVPPVYTGPEIPVPAAGSITSGKVHPVRSSGSLFANRSPLIVLNRSDERKTMFFNIYNLWRWSFMAMREPDLDGFYDKLVENSVKWLVNTEDSKLVRFTTNKEFYSNGEEVIVNAQVYDENYIPVGDAEVGIEITKEEYKQNRILRAVGEGRYETRLDILEPGEYQLRGEVVSSGRLTGKDEVRFTIGDFSMETMKTTMDSVLLGQIAAASNGMFFTADMSDSLLSAISSRPTTIQDQYDIYIWNRGWLFCTIIGLLCLEWFLRKRWGML